MSIEDNLALHLSERERQRVIYWDKRDHFLDLRMSWRASMMRHLFHILPGQKILEIGAGDGTFTKAIIKTTKDECQITTAVFSFEFKNFIESKIMAANLHVVYLDSFPGALQGQKFDFIVAHNLLTNKFQDAFLYAIKSLIKPGGGLILFEPNPWNPCLWLGNVIKQSLAFFRRVEIPLLSNRMEIFIILSKIGYTQINVMPYDFLYRYMPKFMYWPMKNLSIILENFPYIRNLSGSLCIWGRNPSLEDDKDYVVDLCLHENLFGKVSFVVPCHNEDMNVPVLIKRLYDLYGKYIFEIIIVDDNSTDRTAEVTEEMAMQYKHIRLIRRSPPTGVGRALRDGLNQANGEYVVIMDSDFQHIISEMRDLFDVLNTGVDVVVGSRFSRESVLINYAFTKIIANRAFHFLANLLLGKRFRDISNNLKIFRREVIKKISIESDDFAANAETGLKPLLLGYRVTEVPISWINRSVNMGFSTFRIIKTGPNYCKVLLRLFFRRINRTNIS